MAPAYPYPVPAATEPKGVGHDYAYTAEALQEERDSVWTFVKRLGSSVLEGKDLVSVSMPVNLCEPASFLERMTRGWVTMPHYCALVNAATDDAEKLKLVVAMVVSGLHLNTNCKKPFNPVLGETFQAHFEDGTEVFAEQSSHHPPVSTWEVLAADKSWKFTGQAKWSGYFAGNAVKGGQMGTNVLEFSNGYRVQWTLPSIHVGGVLSGNRILDHVGCVDFKDNSQPPLTARVGFGDQRQLVQWMSDGGKWLAGALTGGWLTSQGPQHKDDELSGEIFIASQGEAAKVVLAQVKGSWLKGVDFVDTKSQKVSRYWDRKDTPITPLKKELPEGALPTDSRLRKDIAALREKSIEEAQEAKETVENEQRRLAKLRKG